jgi:hypothetical protein
LNCKNKVEGTRYKVQGTRKKSLRKSCALIPCALNLLKGFLLTL